MRRFGYAYHFKAAEKHAIRVWHVWSNSAKACLQLELVI